MSRFHQAVERCATGRLLGVLALILAVVMMSVQAFDAPWSLVRLKHMTGGVSILDMQFHYSAQGAQDLLTALGPDGRSFYLWRILAALDVVLPALFAAVLTVAMAVSFRGSVDERSPWRLVQWLPLIAALLDYVENVLIATLLVDFPTAHPVIARPRPGWTTTAKQLAYVTSVVVCLTAAAAVSQRPSPQDCSIHCRLMTYLFLNGSHNVSDHAHRIIESPSAARTAFDESVQSCRGPHTGLERVVEPRAGAGPARGTRVGA